MLREGQVPRWVGAERTEIQELSHSAFERPGKTGHQFAQHSRQEEPRCLRQILLPAPAADGEKPGPSVSPFTLEFVVDAREETVSPRRYLWHEGIKHLGKPLKIPLAHLLCGSGQRENSTEHLPEDRVRVIEAVEPEAPIAPRAHGEERDTVDLQRKAFYTHTGPVIELARNVTKESLLLARESAPDSDLD
jgi:hypothetical protein